jgi:serine/threonine protein kinase
MAKLEPERILGTGRFGVAFLCRNRHSGSRVVVKALWTANLDRDVGELFREVQVLEELDHPSILRLRDCDYADATRTRPYLVMDSFDGLTLADHVAEYGTLSSSELVPLACRFAEGLQAAHERGILHRDVKPTNVLVRCDRSLSSSEEGKWRVKLIDFGFASCHQMEISPGGRDSAAPEHLQGRPGKAASPASDVYGFARTCCYALFRTTQPTQQHWDNLERPLAALLRECLAEAPAERPMNFGVVLRRLAQLARPAAEPELVVVPVEVTPSPQPLPRPRPAPPQSQPPVPRPRSVPRPLPEPRRRNRRRVAPDQTLVRRRRAWPWVVGVTVLLVFGSCAGLISLPFWLPSLLLPKLPSFATDQFSLQAFPLPPTGPQPSKPTPTALADDEFEQALKDLESKDLARQAVAGNRLVVTPVKEERREEVSRLLQGVLDLPDQPGFPLYEARLAAARASGKWGTKESVPALLKWIKGWSALGGVAMEALAELGDERAVEPIAALLDDLSKGGAAAKALRSMGPMAEKAVWAYTSASHGHFNRIDAIGILKEVGTEASVPVLRDLAEKDRDYFVKQAAKDALTVLEKRLASKKSARGLGSEKPPE